MTEELEALLSHLYVVGGRPVTLFPPGALVQLAPAHAARPRQRDVLFTLVLPTAGFQAKAAFYERMAQLAAQRYFEQAGGVAEALREVLRSLNRDLYGHNQERPRQPFYADIVCAVLQRQEVHVARTAGGLLLLWRGAALESQPPDLRDPALVQGQPLGQGPEPDIKAAQYTVQAGHVAVLADPNLARIPQEGLQAALAAGGVQAVVERLKGHPLPAAMALVMQFIPPDAPDPVPPPQARPGSRSAPSAGRQGGAAPGPQGGARRPFWQRGGRQASPSAASAPAPQQRSGPAGEQRFKRLWRRGAARGQALTGVVATAAPSLEEIQAGGRNVFLRLAQRALLLLRRGLLRLAEGLAALRRLLERLLPEPEPGRPPALPTPLAASAAMLIPVAVVLLVVALALTTRDETSFERCLSQAQIAVEVARQISENEAGDAQEAWFGAMEAINRCAPRRPDDPVLLTLRDEAQSQLDAFAGVTRCPMTPLRRFEPGADLRGPVLQGPVDLYTLDVSRSAIYRDTLNEEGNALVREGELIVRRGSAVGEFVVQNIIDIDWLTEGGVPRRSALVGLDARTGALVSYSPTFPPATAQQLVGSDRWLRPVAIETWQGRLYILDPVADQIWRYQPAGGSYPGAPEEYFSGDVRPDLENAVDFAIDQNGNVYILQRDGSILKYNAGEPIAFQFTRLPSGGIGTLGSANAMYLDTGLISPGFYIMDAANQIIYETTLGGTFIRAYQAPYGTSFRELTGLAVDSTAEQLYVVARDTLYHIRKCD